MGVHMRKVLGSVVYMAVRLCSLNSYVVPTEKMAED